MMDRINQRMENINRIFIEMDKLYDSVIKEVESLKKSQKSPAALPVLKKTSPVLEKTLPVLEDNGSDIQCGERETNVNILFAGDKNPEVQSLLNVLPVCTHNFLFEYISWPFSMTTAVFIFNLVFEMLSLKAAILNRKVYDPGGCHLIRHLIL